MDWFYRFLDWLFGAEGPQLAGFTATPTITARPMPKQRAGKLTRVHVLPGRTRVTADKNMEMQKQLAANSELARDEIPGRRGGLRGPWRLGRRHVHRIASNCIWLDVGSGRRSLARQVADTYTLAYYVLGDGGFRRETVEIDPETGANVEFYLAPNERLQLDRLGADRPYLKMQWLTPGLDLRAGGLKVKTELYRADVPGAYPADLRPGDSAHVVPTLRLHWHSWRNVTQALRYGMQLIKFLATYFGGQTGTLAFAAIAGAATGAMPATRHERIWLLGELHALAEGRSSPVNDKRRSKAATLFKPATSAWQAAQDAAAGAREGIEELLEKETKVASLIDDPSLEGAKKATEDWDMADWAIQSQGPQ